MHRSHEPYAATTGPGPGRPVLEHDRLGSTLVASRQQTAHLETDCNGIASK